jgi:hypothetical protein
MDVEMAHLDYRYRALIVKDFNYGSGNLGGTQEEAAVPG